MTKVWIKEAYQFYNMIPRTFAPVKYRNRYDKVYVYGKGTNYSKNYIRFVKKDEKF